MYIYVVYIHIYVTDIYIYTCDIYIYVCDIDIYVIYIYIHSNPEETGNMAILWYFLLVQNGRGGDMN